MMKLLAAVAVFALTAASSQAFDHSALTGVLQTHVNGKGMVNYKALKSNPGQLDAYLNKTGAVSEKELKSWSKDEQLAFYINVYNAETLKFIIDNYPVDSIKDLGGFLSTPWDKKVVTLFGEKATLNTVEHKIIRKEFEEPRIHFALVCAAISCPPLRREAYTAAKLDSQLDNQARVFMAQKEKNRIEGDTLYLSSIYSFYKGDFTKGGRSLNDYVDPYIDGSTAGKEVEFTDYDWSLNKQ